MMKLTKRGGGGDAGDAAHEGSPFQFSGGT